MVDKQKLITDWIQCKIMNNAIEIHRRSSDEKLLFWQNGKIVITKLLSID